jgi:hypothetical protein
MTTLTRPSILYYLRCSGCHITFASYFRRTRCPICDADAAVYGFKEIDGGRRDDTEQDPQTPGS